jgi:hypothetical protein
VITKSFKPTVGHWYGINVGSTRSVISKCRAVGETESIFRYRKLGEFGAVDHKVPNDAIFAEAGPQSRFVRIAMKAGTIFLNLDYTRV